MKLIKKTIRILLISFFILVVLVYAFFGYNDKSVEDLKSQYAPTPSAFLEIEGMNVHYRDEGNATDSLPLVLIHGTGSSLHTFDAWTEALKSQKRIVRMDIPGFGLTGPFLNRDYSIDHYTTFIEEFLTKRGIKRCILAGNSLGGQIAWAFTVKYGDRVEKLVLIDAAGYPLDSKSVPIAFVLARQPIANKLLTFITPYFLAKSSIENIYADKSKVTEALVKRYFDLTLRAGNRQAFVDRLTAVYDTSQLPQIRHIQQRTLLLWGEEDNLIPLSNATRFHADLPNDTLVILPHVGHVPMEESPKESLAALLAFLKG